MDVLARDIVLFEGVESLAVYWDVYGESWSKYGNSWEGGPNHPDTKKQRLILFPKKRRLQSLAVSQRVYQGGIANRRRLVRIVLLSQAFLRERTNIRDDST